MDASLQQGALVTGFSLGLYMDAERDALRAKIRDDVLPSLRDVADSLERDFLQDAEPDAVVDRLENALDAVESMLGGEAKADEEIEAVRFVVEEMKEMLPSEQDDVDGNWEEQEHGAYYVEDGLFSDVDDPPVMNSHV